jgi:L-fucose isomerase-like protein
MLYPKIGIRPVIDGRWGGVRESLENQTMGMAQSAKALIESNIRYPDGTPVQCVISNTTIGGGAEAAKCAEQFAGENVVATLSVTPCWCYGSETFDMEPTTIKAVWGFNGTERPGAVYLAAVMAAYAQKGLPAFSIYGKDVQDITDTNVPDDVAEKILRFAHCAVSVGWMKNKSYVNFGGIAMGIAGSYCNADMFQKYFGIRAEWVDMTEIVRRITLEIYDRGFQGQRQWTDWLPNADFTEAIMASSFDWNGTKQPTPFATENDTLNGVAMMLGTLVSGCAPCFHDVRTYWSPDACERVTGVRPSGVAKDGFIHLINSGATALDGSGAAKNDKGEGCMKPFWEMTQDDIKACLEATDWCRANYEYFRGGGFSSHFRCRAEMPVTMLRVNVIDGIGPVLQLAEGYTVDLPDEIHHVIDQRTDPTWPTTWFVPTLTGKGAFKDVYSVMANWGANHGVTVYGHVGADLITLASMLRIPVNMHNVSDDRIFRPHSWSGFGTDDTQSADYRACATYGPLYK